MLTVSGELINDQSINLCFLKKLTFKDHHNDNFQNFRINKSQNNLVENIFRVLVESSKKNKPLH